jgi:serine protease
MAPMVDGAQGLIVRLKDASAHTALQQDETVRRRDTERWRGVLRGAALSGSSGIREPGLRAAGRDQQVLDFGRTLSLEEAERLAQRLRQRPDVDWASPNTMERRLQVSDDPLSSQQWWLKPVSGSNGNVLADRLRGVPGFVSAWRALPATDATGQGPVVAVLDTGITAHPDLAGRVLPGYDFVSDVTFANDGNGRDSDPGDPGDWVSASDRSDARFANCAEQRSSWHGTIIAGLIAAIPDNGIGVAGINRQARILPVRVAGKCGAAVADIVDGMRWAGGLPVAGVPLNPHPARIINISFGGAAACGREYQSAVDELRARGVVVVAAAGNEHTVVSRPASCDGVVGVASLNRDGFKAHYSNFGAALTASGVATVGGDDARAGAWRDLMSDGGLVTVWNNGAQGPGNAEYAKLFGTSFAAPLVSGTLSLMLTANPTLTVEQLVRGVRDTARPHVSSPLAGRCSENNPGRCICTRDTCGAGILDTDQALRFAQNPGSWVSPVRQAAVLDTAELRQALILGQDMPPNPVVVAQANTAGPTTDSTVGLSTPAAAGKGGGAAGAWGALALAVAAATLCTLRRRAAGGAGAGAGAKAQGFHDSRRLPRDMKASASNRA